MTTRKEIFGNYHYANKQLCNNWHNSIPADYLDEDDFIANYDSQNVNAICDYFGLNSDHITGVIVKIDNGDYIEAYFTESSAPYSIYAKYHSIDYYL